MKEEIEFDDYTYVNNGLVNTWMDKYRCKKCGHLGIMTIITSSPLDIMCNSCMREEKIDNILNK